MWRKEKLLNLFGDGGECVDCRVFIPANSNPRFCLTFKFFFNKS